MVKTRIAEFENKKLYKRKKPVPELKRSDSSSLTPPAPKKRKTVLKKKSTWTCKFDEDNNNPDVDATWKCSYDED